MEQTLLPLPLPLPLLLVTAVHKHPLLNDLRSPPRKPHPIYTSYHRLISIGVASIAKVVVLHLHVLPIIAFWSKSLPESGISALRSQPDSYKTLTRQGGVSPSLLRQLLLVSLNYITSKLQHVGISRCRL